MLRCDEHVIFFGGRGLKVLSASSRSLMLLGMENEQLQREPVPISTHFPTADSQAVEFGAWDADLMLSMLGDGNGTFGGEEDEEVAWLCRRIRAM